MPRWLKIVTKYSVNELLATGAMGRKRVSWEGLLAGRFSLITARANFGKTTELRACARRLRAAGQHAVFVALHRVLEESDFQIALDTAEAEAFEAWCTVPAERLSLFIDSLDEAVLARVSGLGPPWRTIVAFSSSGHNHRRNG